MAFVDKMELDWSCDQMMKCPYCYGYSPIFFVSRDPVEHLYPGHPSGKYTQSLYYDDCSVSSSFLGNHL